MKYGGRGERERTATISIVDSKAIDVDWVIAGLFLGFSWISQSDHFADYGRSRCHSKSDERTFPRVHTSNRRSNDEQFSVLFGHRTLLWSVSENEMLFHPVVKAVLDERTSILTRERELPEQHVFSSLNFISKWREKRRAGFVLLNACIFPTLFAGANRRVIFILLT